MRKLWLVLVAVIGLVTAACGSGPMDPMDPMDPMMDAAQRRG
jgi:hypothetical protein